MQPMASEVFSAMENLQTSVKRGSESQGFPGAMRQVFHFLN